MNFFNLFRGEQYRQKLYQIVKKANPQPASETGAKECQRSGVCCWRRPCDLHPGDVERLAAYLGLTPEQTFREYLVVDEFGGKLRLLPRRGQQTGGRYLTSSQTYDIETPCVFLQPDQQNACGVHPVKPTGGATWTCTMSEVEKDAMPDPEWSREALMALGWDGEVDDY